MPLTDLPPPRPSEKASGNNSTHPSPVWLVTRPVTPPELHLTGHCTSTSGLPFSFQLPTAVALNPPLPGAATAADTTCVSVTKLGHLGHLYHNGADSSGPEETFTCYPVNMGQIQVNAAVLLSEVHTRPAQRPLPRASQLSRLRSYQSFCAPHTETLGKLSTTFI